MFHAAEQNDSDAPPFPPRISRRREHTQRLPPRVAKTSIEDTPGADSPPSLQHMVEAVTATAIAAVDRHLTHMGLYPRSEPASSQDFVNNVYPFVTPASVATPPPLTGSVAPTTHPAGVSTDNAYPFVTSASAPTADGFCGPNHSPRRGFDEQCLPRCDPRACISAPTPGGLRGPNREPRPGSIDDCPPPATSFAPALYGPLAPARTYERILYDDSSSQASNTSSSLGLRAEIIANLQAAYCTLDMRRVPRVQPRQFRPSTDRTFYF